MTCPLPAAPSTDHHWLLFLPRGRTLQLGGSPRVMGIVNVTPDSFSDGGSWLSPERAITHALEQLRAGADLVDLGAESTRPGGGDYGAGAEPVTAAEELARLLPVLEGLRPLTDAPISVDTRKAAVAAAALGAGADLINDVSALGDSMMAAVVADVGCPLVLMHSRGELRSMQREISFDEVAEEVASELRGALESARHAGIPGEQLILDPGIGFGKTVTQNLQLLWHLDALQALGRPLLVGASRKSFIGHLTDEPPADRLAGSLAATGWAARRRAAIVRVHDVVETVAFLKVWNAIDSVGDAVR